MGLGDWIMATADAQEVYSRHGVRVVFGDGVNKYWSEVFEGNPIIAKDLKKNERFAWIRNYPSKRPYIKQIHKDHYDFHEDYKVKKGYLYPDNVVKNDYVIIEPNVKREFELGGNKDWGMDNWKKLVSQLDCDWKQLGTGNFIDKSHAIKTDNFMDAVRILAGAKLLITTDGALHHAAAALGIPAIVLWGGVASPKNLGYDDHINIWHGDKPCGSHSVKCEHCKKAMAKITVEEVLGAYNKLTKPVEPIRRGRPKRANRTTKNSKDNQI